MTYIAIAVVSCGIGLLAGQSFGEWYRTKRECRECLRTRVKYGMEVDGKSYKVVEVV